MMPIKRKNDKTDKGGYMSIRRQILNKNSSFAAQEAYKSLRASVRFALRSNGCKRISMTSAMANEGKSITMLNLAISVAMDGQKVLLIDADMRRPSQSRMLVEKASPGLSNVLAGMVSAEEAIRLEMYPNLDILFSGDVPPNPSELLGSEKMRELIEGMSQKYDYILVDTPPINLVSDAAIVTHLLDGVLLLVRQGKSRRDELKRAISNLELTGITPMGIVFNGVELREGKDYSYYG